VQTDSLNIQIDTIPVLPDTSAQEPQLVEIADTVAEPVVEVEQPVYKPVKPIAEVVVEKPVPQINTDSIIRDSILKSHEAINPFKPFIHSQSGDSAKVHKTAESVPVFQSQQFTGQTISELRNPSRVFEKEWVFGISIFITLLIIIVRVYYEKYLQTIFSSLLNIQIAEKLMRDKNVIVKRGNWLLNICFIFSLGLYVYITAERFSLVLPFQNAFFKYFYLVLIIAAILVGRFILIQVTAFIFDSLPVYREYMHNSFILNKNLGLYLMPLMASYFYVPSALGHAFYIAATVIIMLTVVFRYFKALQIIFKHNVFLFYSILYLCTLEILPALVGIKFVLTLR